MAHFQKSADAVTFRPLVYLTYIPQSTYASQYHNADCFWNTTKVSVVFLICFYFLEVFYQFLFLHTLIIDLFSSFCKIDFPDKTGRATAFTF